MTRIFALATLAVAAIAAAPAQAHPPKPKPKPKPVHCKAVGFDARGALVSQALTQTAGVATAKRSDDRYSGTLTVDVKRANHRAPLGIQTYTLDQDHVSFAATAPKAGDRVKLYGKLARSGCASALDVRNVKFKAAR
jgi:hypothetical protein